MQMRDKVKITIDVVLRELNEKQSGERYCALTLDSEEPELLEKIKSHIEIFKSFIIKTPQKITGNKYER